MAQTERLLHQRIWNGRVRRFADLIGFLEPSDVLWKTIESDVAACTRAYLANDVGTWYRNVLRIRLRLYEAENGPLECHPTWC